jgi:hypothetical protein
MDTSKPAAPPALSRRTLFAGAGAVGALGAVAAVSGLQRAVEVPVALAQTTADTTGGYQLTDHIKQYYASARI